VRSLSLSLTFFHAHTHFEMPSVSHTCTVSLRHTLSLRLSRTHTLTQFCPTHALTVSLKHTNKRTNTNTNILRFHRGDGFINNVYESQIPPTCKPNLSVSRTQSLYLISSRVPLLSLTHTQIFWDSIKKRTASRNCPPLAKLRSRCYMCICIYIFIHAYVYIDIYIMYI